jgi:hypothetical protein
MIYNDCRRLHATGMQQIDYPQNRNRQHLRPRHRSGHYDNRGQGNVRADLGAGSAGSAAGKVETAPSRGRCRQARRPCCGSGSRRSVAIWRPRRVHDLDVILFVSIQLGCNVPVVFNSNRIAYIDQHPPGLATALGIPRCTVSVHDTDIVPLKYERGKSGSP